MNGYIHSGVKGKIDKIWKPNPGTILVSNKLGNAVESGVSINDLAELGSGETTVEHSMSLLTGQAVSQMIGGRQNFSSYVRFYSEADYNKWLANPADSSISPMTVVSYKSAQPVEFLPIDFSNMSFEPYAMSARIYLYNAKTAVNTYDPNTSQHIEFPEPVLLDSDLIPAYLEEAGVNTPSNFYFNFDYNEETDESIFQIVQNGDNVLQSVVTVNGVTATARVDLSNLNNETIENLLNTINTVDAKLKDNYSNYSTLPEFETYLKRKYRLTEVVE